VIGPVGFPEKSVHCYHTAQCHNPEPSLIIEQSIVLYLSHCIHLH